MKRFISFIIVIITIITTSCSPKEKKYTLDGVYEFDTEYVKAALMQSCMKEFADDPVSLALSAAFVDPMAQMLYNTIEFSKEGRAVMRKADREVLLDTTYIATKDSVYIGDLSLGVFENTLTSTQDSLSIRYNKI